MTPRIHFTPGDAENKTQRSNSNDPAILDSFFIISCRLSSAMISFFFAKVHLNPKLNTIFLLHNYRPHNQFIINRIVVISGWAFSLFTLHGYRSFWGVISWPVENVLKRIEAVKILLLTTGKRHMKFLGGMMRKERLENLTHTKCIPGKRSLLLKETFTLYPCASPAFVSLL